MADAEVEVANLQPTIIHSTISVAQSKMKLTLVIRDQSRCPCISAKKTSIATKKNGMGN
jgi:hypothetical protein